MKFDIDLRVRGAYTTKFGKHYLTLKQEYGVDGARLIKRVFADANKIIVDRQTRRAEALQKQQEVERELLRLKAGEDGL